MNNTLLQKHHTKVNNVICNVMWLLVVAHLVYVLVFPRPMDNIIRALVILVPNTIFMLIKNKPKFQKVAPYFPPIILMLLANNYYTQMEMTIYCMIGSFVLAAMYFEHRYFLHILIIGNISELLITYGLQLDMLLVSNLMLSTNIVALAIYYLAKWGNTLILDSIKDSLYNKDLVNKLEHTFTAIDTNTSALNQHISSNTTNVSHIAEVNKQLYNISNEVAEGTIYQSSTISDINTTMQHIKDRINTAYTLSDSTTKSSKDAKTILEDALDSISMLNSNVDNMGIAVSSSITRVNELISQVERVTTALSNIKSIATQTNLLALNASIEAARSGAAGKGFSIIATEITSLANDSSVLSSEIDNIMVHITSTINNVLSEIVDVEKTSSIGQTSAKTVTLAFNKVIDTFEAIDTNILQNLNAIYDIKSLCTDTANGLNDIASVSIKNSGLAQETLAITEDQTSSLDDIQTATQHIKSLSEALNALTSSYQV